jgi:hypothetical protein
MAWVSLSVSPHLPRASLITGRCAACSKVPAPGSRPWTSGERKSARGNTVPPRKPRAVKSAQAAERRGPKEYVERMAQAGVAPWTGQTATEGEGDPPASASPPGGTRETPWVVRSLTQRAVKPAHVQGVEEGGAHAGQPGIGGEGRPQGWKAPMPRNARRAAGQHETRAMNAGGVP